jgi:methylenetetrahydrofolate--tRNA-(uracil-5-)-methyltransferase
MGDSISDLDKSITIIGAGLAGCEAALQLAKRGWQVKLYEMRPQRMTPAHQTAQCAEIVCSNSLKSLRSDTAAGLLKAEMQLLGCQLLELAKQTAVPAGHALAVDRDAFSAAVTAAIVSHPGIELVREEIKTLPSGKVILATGPLTSDALMQDLIFRLGEEQLYFFDAIAPIVSADSLDRSIIFDKSRYDKGEADYLNCPFNKEEYLTFVHALQAGEKHAAHEFENELFQELKFQFYENCLPIEELARRGDDTLRFGVLRPVGLEDPRTGRRPYAVLQLRAENVDGSAYNLVGCQTMLRYGVQKEIFRTIPGFAQAEFLRYGSIHRNSYLNSPEVLTQQLSLKTLPEIWLAGQFSGVEGYTESIAMGLLISLIVDAESKLPILPETTLLGQFWRRLTGYSVAQDTDPIVQQDSSCCQSMQDKSRSTYSAIEQDRHPALHIRQRFQPVNANFGILPAVQQERKDKNQKKAMYYERSLADLQQWLTNQNKQT